jgi:sortase (surface protein transpeptidase)
MDPHRRRRRFLAPALALTLAVELSLVALAVGPATLARPVQPQAASATRPDVVAGPRQQGAEHPADRLTIFRGGVPQWLTTPAPAGFARPAVRTVPTPASAEPNVAVAETPAPAVAPKPAKTKTPAKAPAKAPAAKAPAPSYAGKNHLWIPALGVNRSVSFYACSRSTALANVVYRWGCGGSNNVYLMGHAWGVMRPLHDAYVSGRLKKGMQVIYADANGRVTRYSVSFWKVVSPVGAGWAFAAQATPSMTLQTCVGARSQSRLVVRLVKSG